MKPQRGRNILVLGSLFIVVAVVIWGFILTGSPGYNRKLAGDRRRSEDIDALRNAIEQYHRDYKELPRTLEDLSNRQYSYWYKNHREDPTTNQPYGYTPKNTVTYDLCASFELDSKDIARMHNVRDRTVWEHPAGRHCFEFTIPAGRHG